MARLNSTYVLTAKVGEFDTYMFHYDCNSLEETLEKLWHEDYPEHLIGCDERGMFPIDIIAIPDADGEVVKTFHLTFNCAAFDHYFDKGWSASSTEPNQRYTFDQFMQDIERKEEPDVKQITDVMDRWADFCYNHPPYDEVILWVVGGSKQHYLYQHFCSKWLHLCENVCDNDTMSTWIKFYRTLDRKWAERLMQYVYCEWKKQQSTKP